MKTRNLSLLIVLCITGTLCAADFRFGNLHYSIISESDRTVEVTQPDLCPDSFNIPDSVTWQGTVYRVTRIGSYAFTGCNINLTSVTIPNSVTSIGDAAFSGTGLTSVSIPNSVEYIGFGAFFDCTSLASITMGNSVRNLGGAVFSGCTSLTSIAIPSSVDSVTYDTFSGCTNLASVTIGEGVTSIGNGAFRNCTGLTSVTIPNSVTSLGGGAFWGCASLTSATIPNSVTSLGGGAFSDCTNLDSITIPNSVTSLGDGAFRDCTGLTSVTIGSSVTYIGNSAFSGCTNLTSITIPNSVTYIGNETFSGCTGLAFVTLGEGVTSLGNGAFSDCTNLDSITIPNNVTYMGSNVLKGCTGLISVTLGDGITSIEDHAFSGFTNLVSVTMGNSVRYIGTQAFSACTGLTAVTIPNSVDSVGSYAFSGCTGITSVTLGNNVTSIGFCAFMDCSGLTSVTIPNSVKRIENDAFSGCGLKKVNYEGDVKGWLSIDLSAQGSPIRCSRNLYINDVLLTDLVIPDDVTTLSDAFAYDTCLTSVVIGNSVTDISDRTFDGCTGLTSVSVKAGNTKYDSRNNCNAIIETATNTLVQGFSMTTIPNTVTSIGEEAFFECTGLTSITIPNSVTNIGEGAFMECTGLTSITIPNSIDSVGIYAFAGCTGLTSITIPNSVTSIGDDAFVYCTGLVSVVIGNNNELTIGRSVFEECESLKKVTCYADVPPTVIFESYEGEDGTIYRSGAFDTCRLSEMTLYVPVQAVDAYKEAEEWKEFAHIVPIGATSTDTDELVIAPSTTDVTITWPETAGAETYTIIITKNGEIICTLTFDSTGQLANIAFAAPARRGSTRHAPAALRTQSGFRFTITGLESDTQYGYSIVTKDHNEQPLSTYDGTFCTTNHIPTAIDNELSGESSFDNAMHTRKVFRDGQVLIQHNGKIYTPAGAEMK